MRKSVSLKRIIYFDLSNDLLDWRKPSRSLTPQHRATMARSADAFAERHFHVLQPSYTPSPRLPSHMTAAHMSKGQVRVCRAHGDVTHGGPGV